LPSHQSAYRAHYSTETAIAAVHDELVCNIESGKVSVLVLLDLSAAFDTVDHKILLEVLDRCFGVKETVLDWFDSYLADRTQIFQHEGQRSEPWSKHEVLEVLSAFRPAVKSKAIGAHCRYSMKFVLSYL